MARDTKLDLDDLPWVTTERGGKLLKDYVVPKGTYVETTAFTTRPKIVASAGDTINAYDDGSGLQMRVS